MAPLSLTLIVAATARDLGIGRAGALPWRLRREMKYFADVTTRSRPDTAVPDDSDDAITFNAVIMGRTTWESIPARFRPLRGRMNIVLSRSGMVDGVPAWAPSLSQPSPPFGPDVSVQTASLDDALALLAAGRDAHQHGRRLGRVFVIGGASVYRHAIELPQARSLLLTRINSPIECDTFFPPIEIINGDKTETEPGKNDNPDDSPRPTRWREMPQAALEQFVGREAEPDCEDGISYQYCLLERVD